MEKEKTVRMRRLGNRPGKVPGRVRYDSIDGIRKCGEEVVLYFDNVGDELEVTIRPRKTKRERKLELLRLIGTDYSPEEVLDAFEAIDREDP